jgi:hypothetical protein
MGVWGGRGGQSQTARRLSARKPAFSARVSRKGALTYLLSPTCPHLLALTCLLSPTCSHLLVLGLLTAQAAAGKKPRVLDHLCV